MEHNRPVMDMRLQGAIRRVKTNKKIYIEML